MKLKSINNSSSSYLVCPWCRLAITLQVTNTKATETANNQVNILDMANEWDQGGPGVKIYHPKWTGTGSNLIGFAKSPVSFKSAHLKIRT